MLSLPPERSRRSPYRRARKVYLRPDPSALASAVADDLLLGQLGEYQFERGVEDTFEFLGFEEHATETVLLGKGMPPHGNAVDLAPIAIIWSFYTTQMIDS